MTIEIIEKITKGWTKEDIEAADPSFKKMLESRKNEWKELEKLKGEIWNPEKYFPDYCVINNKYTTELHDFYCQDSKDFWGNIWTVKTCQRKGCGFKTESYSSYVPGSIPDKVNIKLNAWDMLKVKELLNSITNNKETVNSIKQILNKNKDCREVF